MKTADTGTRIRSLRERKAWTQEHLATAAGISPRTVQRAEEGVMSAETRTAIAGALDVPVESFAKAPELPKGWPRIVPTLVYEDSKAALPWLEKAFGFITRLKVPRADGQVVHSELVLGDAVVMVGHVSASDYWKSPRKLGGISQSVFVFVDDLDEHYARARQAGATIVSEPESSHGMRRYRCRDLEGHEWCFSVADSEDAHR